MDMPVLDVIFYFHYSNVNVYFRFFEASKAANHRKLSVRAKPGRAYHLHLFGQGADHRRRTGGRRQCDDRTAARQSGTRGEPAAGQNVVSGKVELVQWKFWPGAHFGILH